MKSVLVLCGVVGAFSDASDWQIDEVSMLQGHNVVRQQSKSKTMTAKDAKSILKNMQDVAKSLVEGSDTTMSQDEITDLLNTAGEAIAQLSPVLRQQLENAQQQIDDAISAFQGCQTMELRDDLERHVAAVESCSNTLDQLRTAEARQCGVAEDCPCEEARVRTTDQEELCFTTRQLNEVAFCDNHATCSMMHQCHSTEADVYDRLRNDVQAEMALLIEEYTAVEQVKCLNDLSIEILTPPLSPTDAFAMAACLDVDVSSININYPATPAEPAACAAHADLRCVAGYASLPGRSVEDWWNSRLESRVGQTAVQCAQMCDRDDRCVGFEYLNSLSYGEDWWAYPGTCYLRSSVADRYTSPVRTFFQKLF